MIKRSRSICKNIGTDDDEVRAFSLVTTVQEVGPENKFFGSLHLSPNGGLYEVRGLYAPARLVGATIFVLVLALNFRSICVRAVAAITGKSGPQALLAHERFLQGLAPGWLTPAEVVAWFELLCLLYYVLEILGDLRVILLSRRRDSSGEYRYWRRVSHLMKDLLPALQSFSAMKVLQYITPPILNADLLSLMKTLKKENKSGAYRLLRTGWFFLQRAFLFAFGFEAFLIKFRDVASGLSDLQGAEFAAICRMAIFMNQMLGVVQLSAFSNKRLFRFIFGGVDNFIDPDEERKMYVWKAALVRRIWDEFKSSPIKFFAVAITFNDVDFQRLVLDDDENNEA